MRRGAYDADPPRSSLAASSPDDPHGMTSSRGHGLLSSSTRRSSFASSERDEYGRSLSRTGSLAGAGAGVDIPERMSTAASASRRARVGAAPSYDAATRRYESAYADRAEISSQPRVSRASAASTSDGRPDWRSPTSPDGPSPDRRVGARASLFAYERCRSDRERDARDADIIARALSRTSLSHRRDRDRDDFRDHSDDDDRRGLASARARVSEAHTRTSATSVGAPSSRTRASLDAFAERRARRNLDASRRDAHARGFEPARIGTYGRDHRDSGAHAAAPARAHDGDRDDERYDDRGDDGDERFGFKGDFDVIAAAAAAARSGASATERAALTVPAPIARRVVAFDRPRGLRGLVNLGNTCFMASCLQCLAHAPPLAEFFLSDADAGDRARITPGSLAAATQRVIRGIHAGGGASSSYGARSSSGSAHDPRDFLRALDRHPPLDLFADGDQHDSQEFLRYLLDTLNDALNTVRVAPPYREEKDDFSEPERDKAERLWNQYRARTSSVVADAFAGQLQSSVECHACGKASTSYDPFWDLSLPLRAPRKGSARGGGGGGGDGGGTLSRTGSLLRYMSGGGSGVGRLGVLDCLEAFAEDDALSGADAFSCPRCKVRGAATKRLRVRRWPRVLVLHLKRFQWNDRGRPGRKIDAVVDVPAKISLAPFLAEDARGGDDDDGPEYRLFAVTNHVGSLSGGHYTAACDAGAGEWYAFDDERVSSAGAPPSHSRNAYVLMYALT